MRSKKSLRERFALKTENRNSLNGQWPLSLIFFLSVIGSQFILNLHATQVYNKASLAQTFYMLWQK